MLNRAPESTSPEDTIHDSRPDPLFEKVHSKNTGHAFSLSKSLDISTQKLGLELSNAMSRLLV